MDSLLEILTGVFERLFGFEHKKFLEVKYPKPARSKILNRRGALV
jgi:hypothetical protein